MSERYDSLDRHYKIIDKLNSTTTVLFWTNAILSISVFFVDELNIKNLLLFFFIITTLAYFSIDNYLSIFKNPEVEDKRRLHMLTKSFNVSLDNEKTNKYYNNEIEPSLLKLGAHVFENSLFAKTVTYKMVKEERIKVGIFIVIFFAALLFRTTELELISILSQTLFASTLITGYLRLEVLHHKNNITFDCLYNIFLLYNKPTQNDERLSAKLLDCVMKYESAKAYSGVKQDSKIFHKINKEVTQEWKEIKYNLNIGASQ